MDRQNVSEDNTEEMEQIIRDLKCTNQELQRQKDERDIALKMAMNKITNLQENEKMKFSFLIYNDNTLIHFIAVKTLELENQKLDIKLSRGMIISEMLC